MAAKGVSYGRRLVPQVLDELATAEPERVYASIPKTTDVKDGYRDITMADLARCVNFMAKWIEDKFGRSNSFETITYIGLSDLRGVATFLGAIKTGYKLLVTSPRNPPSVNYHLMKQTGSARLIHAAELAPLIKPLQEEFAQLASSDVVPSFQVMLDSNPEPYPYARTFEEARNDPIIVLHSSGSTGLPKPITITHGSVAAHDNDHNVAAPVGRDKMDTTVFTTVKETRIYIVFPFFHLGGWIFFIDHAILGNLTLVLGPPHIAPDAELLKEVAEQQNLQAIFAPPTIWEQLLHDPQAVDLLKPLDYVVSAGAPLPQAVGDRISSVVKLRIWIGSTETFPLPELEKSAKDWKYHEFAPFMRHEMRLYDESTGTFELIILADEQDQDTAPVYHNLPGVNPFYTKDLFTKHPTKPNLYEYYGRRDDILVLANGEKVNPIPMEQHVQADPRLNGVLLIGSGRNQTALIVETRDPLAELDRANFLETLWPRLEEANSHISGQGRVARGMVIYASSHEKPFTRTGKGTIVRKLTEEAYKDEIDGLYLSSSRQDNLITVDLEGSVKTVYESTAITIFLREVLAVSVPPASTFGEEEDFFSHGLDSVQTLEITANLKRNLQRLTAKSVAWISPRTIFRNSTLAGLSRLFGQFLNEGVVSSDDSPAARAVAVNDAVARYVDNLPSRTASPVPAASEKPSGSTVAIIGSTGYVGSYLLAALLRNSTISKIYCLNRGSDASARNNTTLYKLDKDLDTLTSKLTFFKIELGSLRLGLSQAQWQQIANEADVVVYNSWRLDLGLAIHSFDPFLRATRDLIDLSVQSQRSMRIVFVSSMSSVQGLAITGATVPETPVEDPLAALNTGYGQSKLAAEHILVTAHRKSGIPVSVVRLGQVGGPSQGGGEWADQPWISAMIRSSKTLGVFPSPVTPIDWVPVDTVATILESIVLQPAQEADSLQFFNVVSEPQSGTLLVEVLRELGAIGSAELVTLPDWVDKLRHVSVSSATDVARLPAVRLLDFYDLIGNGTDCWKFATARTQAVSGVDLGPLKRGLLASWLKSWKL